VSHLVKPDKSRYVWLYLPSKGDKKRWQAIADKAKSPLSTFCISIIEEKLAEEEDFKPRRELTKENETLKAENKALRDDLRQKAVVLERFEADLKKYRSQSFLENDYHGVRRYSKEIVELLKSRGQVDSYKILEALEIDPRESELVKAVSRQLEELEGYGLIKAEGRSWQWIV
jgi:regulator of replication initiation timing